MDFRVQKCASVLELNKISHRQQKVIISGDSSSWLPVLSGVPQGSSLGPLCFTLYMGDISDLLQNDCKALIYADDCKIFKEITTIDDAKNLQLILNEIEEWCRKWKMTINPIKTVAMKFTLKERPTQFEYRIFNENITWVKHHKDLGVTFDSKLNFGNHIECIVAKAMKMVGLLYRFTDITHYIALRT